MKVLAVVPAYNEEQRIAVTLEAIKDIPEVTRILVVNDGSTDGTSAVARASNVDVLDLPQNMGKGGALTRAADYIKEDIVLLLDADLGETAREGARLLPPVLKDEADITVAVFPSVGKKGGFGLVKGLAAWAIAREGLRVREPLSGQRAMKASVYKDLLPFYSGYGIETGMTIRALRKGYRVVEVPVNMAHAETGKDIKGFIHRGRQFVDVARVILRESRRGSR